MLSDVDIVAALVKGDISFDPLLRSDQYQPASVDLDLGTSFYKSEIGGIDNFDKQTIRIAPGEFFLATTRQSVKIGPGHVGRIEGKSSFGRLGLTVHITAGFIDPGFEGQVTLEMVNLSQKVIELTIGEPICQMSFERLDSPCLRPYGSEGLGSHYQNQKGAVKSALTPDNARAV